MKVLKMTKELPNLACNYGQKSDLLLVGKDTIIVLEKTQIT